VVGVRGGLGIDELQ